MSLRIASNQLIKGNLRAAVKAVAGGSEIEPMWIDPATYPGGTGGAPNWFFEMLNGNPGYFKFDGFGSCVEAYEKCPVVSAIINRKAQAYINGKTWMLNTQGKVATGEAAKRMNTLFDRPNPLQSRKQFEAQGYIYYQCFGFNIVLCMTPFGFDRTYTRSMWNIPVNMVDIKETENLFYNSNEPTLQFIVLNYKGKKITLNIDNLFIQKDITASFDTLLFPGSKLKAMEKPIRNIIGAYDSRNTLINNRGPMGIFTDEGRMGGTFVGMPMTDTEKAQMQRDLKKYGLRKGQVQAVIAAGALKWQSMGYDVGQLKLMEEVKDSSMAVCDGLNFPPHLLGLIDPTYNNQNAAEKGLYQNSIIPDSDNLNEQWNNWFGLSEYNIVLDKDFNHLPVLQEDKAAMADVRVKLNQAFAVEWEKGLSTKNQWRIALGEDPVPGDDIYIGDIKQSDEPLAVQIGVGGVQALIEVLTAQGLSEDAKQAALEIIFGLQPNDAARMAVSNSNGNQTTQTPDGGATGQAEGSQAGQNQSSQQQSNSN